MKETLKGIDEKKVGQTVQKFIKNDEKTDIRCTKDPEDGTWKIVAV